MFAVYGILTLWGSFFQSKKHSSPGDAMQQSLSGRKPIYALQTKEEKFTYYAFKQILFLF